MAIKNIITLTETPTISTSAYASGDLLGTLIKFKSSDLTENKRCLIQNISLSDLDAEEVNIDVVFFSENPSSTTFTDNAALDIADADITKIIHVESLGAYTSFSDNSVAVSGSIAIPVTFTDSIYASLVVRGAPTYTATTDIKLTLSIIQD